MMHQVLHSPGNPAEHLTSPFTSSNICGGIHFTEAETSSHKLKTKHTSIVRVFIAMEPKETLKDPESAKLRRIGNYTVLSSGFTFRMFKLLLFPDFVPLCTIKIPETLLIVPVWIRCNLSIK